MKLFITKLSFTLVVSCVLAFTSYGQNGFASTVFSPDGKLSVRLTMNDGKAFYTVKLDTTEVIVNSPLGLICEDEDFSQNLVVLSATSPKEVKDKYTMLYGKQQNYSYKATKRDFIFSTKRGNEMRIIFQVSNDGVAFRYVLPDKVDNRKVIGEASAFNFPTGTKTWIQPMPEAKTGWSSTQPSYEEYYVQNILVDSLPVSKPGWIYPALFNTGSNWVLLSETSPYRDYCATRLMHQMGTSNFTVGFPDAREVFTGGNANPESSASITTPWRIIAISNSLPGIVASTLGTDLAKPAVKGDFSYVKPGRSSWSWVLLKDDSTIFDIQKRFVDFASQMKWEYCLVDALWDKQIGNEKMAELTAYAKTKNVGILVWYNSAGDWNSTFQTPKNKLLTEKDRRAEFEWLQKIGVKGIKVDFFGGDGQSMMKYYVDILEDAAKYKLMVNFHGCTLPRGWQRTYPNLVSMEAVRGFENVTFEQTDADKQANQCCMLPFTRNVFDPMDYTPMCLSEVPYRTRRTSNAFELALPFMFHSGVTHMAETPAGVAAAPDFVRDLLVKVPVLWNESRLLDGFPGEYVVMASKKQDTWYISAINGSDVDKTVTLDLSFVNKSKGQLVTDGETNRSFVKQELELSPSKTTTITIKAHGGFVLTF
jgi:hypothetical protein